MNGEGVQRQAADSDVAVNTSERPKASSSSAGASPEIPLSQVATYVRKHFVL